VCIKFFRRHKALADETVLAFGLMIDDATCAQVDSIDCAQRSRMLAPRKKLWSTPIEAIEKAIELLNLTPKDVVMDIGAGDVRPHTLTHTHTHTPPR
jgi:hypothetical protein